MRHAYVKVEKSGAVSIRWWVDAEEGVAARTMIHVHPGETAYGVSYADWHRLGGSFVDLDEIPGNPPPWSPSAN